MVYPYYQDDHATLYHGNCLEVTEWLSADVLVTDPPYGVSYTGFGGRSYWNDASKHDPVIGDMDFGARDAALSLWAGRPALVFGAWRVSRPTATRQVLIWDKSDGKGQLGALDLPWGPTHEEIYVIGRGFVGRRAGSVIRQPTWNSQASERPNHPTPKPIPLMEYLISRCPLGVVADPFVGSGSTLVAAKVLGRKSIGVELDERYCELAARRLSQDVIDFSEPDEQFNSIPTDFDRRYG